MLNDYVLIERKKSRMKELIDRYEQFESMNINDRYILQSYIFKIEIELLNLLLEDKKITVEKR